MKEIDTLIDYYMGNAKILKEVRRTRCWRWIGDVRLLWRCIQCRVGMLVLLL